MSIYNDFFRTIGGVASLEAPVLTIGTLDVKDTSIKISVSAYVGPSSAKTIDIFYRVSNTGTWNTLFATNISSLNEYTIPNLTSGTTYDIKARYNDLDNNQTPESSVVTTTTTLTISGTISKIELSGSWLGDDSTFDNTDIDTYGYLFKADGTYYTELVGGTNQSVVFYNARQFKGLQLSNDDLGDDLTTTHTYHSESITATLASVDPELDKIVLALRKNRSAASITTLGQVPGLSFKLLDTTTATKTLIKSFDMSNANSAYHALAMVYRVGTGWSVKLIDKAMTNSNQASAKTAAGI